MRPNLPFLSAASNAFLKSGGLLRSNKRLVKDARLLLPLTEVMKIARLTSPPLYALPQSSPRPRLRHGRRLALLFHPNQTLYLYILSFTLSLALLPRLPSLLASFSPSFSPRGYLTELRRATYPEESHSSFCSPFSLAEFHAAASNLSPSTVTGPDKVAYPMLKHLPRSGMDFFFHIFNLS